jgi:hypothetical protein
VSGCSIKIGELRNDQGLRDRPKTIVNADGWAESGDPFRRTRLSGQQSFAGAGSRLAIDHPGRRGGVLNRSGTVRVFRQVPQGNKSIILIN